MLNGFHSRNAKTLTEVKGHRVYLRDISLESQQPVYFESQRSAQVFEVFNDTLLLFRRNGTIYQNFLTMFMCNIENKNQSTY